MNKSESRANKLKTLSDRTKTILQKVTEISDLLEKAATKSEYATDKTVIDSAYRIWDSVNFTAWGDHIKRLSGVANESSNTRLGNILSRVHEAKYKRIKTWCGNCAEDVSVQAEWDSYEKRWVVCKGERCPDCGEDLGEG